MEIILLERIERLGQMGDVVTVKDGFARNFLLPQGKALRANKANRAVFEGRRVQLEATNLENQTEAQSVAGKIDGTSYIIIRQAGEAGQLYGSVSTRDIASLMDAEGASITRNQVVLDSPIKLLGLHDVRIVLHPEVSTTVVVNVARTQEEAERQARGEDVNADQFADEDDAVDAEEVFEDGEHAQDAADELVEDAEDEAAAEANATAREEAFAAEKEKAEAAAKEAAETAEAEASEESAGDAAEEDKA